MSLQKWLMKPAVTLKSMLQYGQGDWGNSRKRGGVSPPSDVL